MVLRSVHEGLFTECLIRAKRWTSHCAPGDSCLYQSQDSLTSFCIANNTLTTAIDGYTASLDIPRNAQVRPQKSLSLTQHSFPALHNMDARNKALAKREVSSFATEA